MDTEQNFSGTESLALINRMITQAKEDFADNSFNSLLWGWAVALTALTHYALLQLGYGTNSALVWAVTLPIVGVVAFVYNYRRGRRQGPMGQRSTINRATGYLWGSIGAAFGITTALMFQPGMGFHPAYVFYICLFGIGTVATGGLIQFRPLVVGGFLCFPLAVAAIFVTGPALLLVLALALVVSYIIPGHLLRADARRKQTQYQQAAMSAPSYV